jgi:hypothetical protein
MTRPQKEECEKVIKRPVSFNPDVYRPTLEDADANHEGNFSEAVNKRLRWSFGDKAYTNNSSNGLQQQEQPEGTQGTKNGR